VSVNALEFDLNATDNTASVSTTVTAPDLVPTAMSVSKSGSRVYVSDTVNNQGNASAGAFTLKYYLSTDTAHNSNDLALATASGGSTACTRTVTSLNVGASSSISNKLCYKPAGVVSGTRYYILTVDDADKQVIESNEVNNVRATTGTVRW
jgi:subtilase family serine protease